MVYLGHANRYTTTQLICSWMVKNPGQGVVLTLAGVRDNAWRLYDPNDSRRPQKNHSIVICTYGRPDSLNETLKSLTFQTVKDFEVLLITEKGCLSELRQRGLERASGSIVSFIDDDVHCPSTWLEGVLAGFRNGALGVTGPTIITEEYQKNRDCLRFKRLRQIQEWCFKTPRAPSHLSVCGSPSMVSNFEGCSYRGEVQYLEACNMSVRRKEALDVGGFDSVFRGTSEWCEVDLALKLGKSGSLLFRPEAMLFHRPSKAGIYRERLRTDHRWRNFILFQKRWVKPSPRTYAYRGFVWCYFKLKNYGLI